LIGPPGKIAVDIRLANRERWSLWCIYDEVLEEIAEEVENPR
jgi:hypothetical protein